MHLSRRSLLAVLLGASASCHRAPASSDGTVRRGLAEESSFAWAVPEPGRAVQVEVLNASGTPGLARVVTRTLRSRGFDVVLFASAGGAGDSTQIVVRRGARDAADKVRNALGRGVVREQRDTTRRVDVTVLLGADFVRR